MTDDDLDALIEKAIGGYNSLGKTTHQLRDVARAAIEHERDRCFTEVRDAHALAKVYEEGVGKWDDYLPRYHTLWSIDSKRAHTWLEEEGA